MAVGGLHRVLINLGVHVRLRRRYVRGFLGRHPFFRMGVLDSVALLCQTLKFLSFHDFIINLIDSNGNK